RRSHRTLPWAAFGIPDQGWESAIPTLDRNPFLAAVPALGGLEGGPVSNDDVPRLEDAVRGVPPFDDHVLVGPFRPVAEQVRHRASVGHRNRRRAVGQAEPQVLAIALDRAVDYPARQPERLP